MSKIKKSRHVVFVGIGNHKHIYRTVVKRHYLAEFAEHNRPSPAVYHHLDAGWRFYENCIPLPDVKKGNGKSAASVF